MRSQKPSSILFAILGLSLMLRLPSPAVGSVVDPNGLEIRYDNGVLGRGGYGTHPFDAGSGVRFTPPYASAKLLGAMICFVPHEEGYQENFTLRVENASHNVLVSFRVFYTVHNEPLDGIAWGTATLLYVDLKSYDIWVSGDFYIFAINHACIYVDTGTVGSWRNYTRDVLGNYYQYEMYGSPQLSYGNVMIRAYVVPSNAYPPLAVTLTYPTDGATVTSCPVEFKARVMSGTSPIQDATVKFYFDGNLIGSSSSDYNGYATCQYYPPSAKDHIWYVTVEKSLYNPDTSPTWIFTYKGQVIPFDFSLSNNADILATQGSSGSNTVTVTLAGGSTQPVTLSASGLPSGASASFDPTSSSPTFSSICTIMTSPSTAAGSYPITVTGSGGGLSRTTTFTLFVSPYSKGMSRIVLDASPKPGYINKPVDISGVMYASWRCIRDGMVVGKPVEIVTGWGFSKVLTTDYYGRFSAITNCPPQGGTYPITATFYEDQDLTASSTTISYEVIAKIPTTITISYVANRQFEGYLRRADTGAYLSSKPVRLTVHYLSGTTWQTATFDLQTRQDGYYSLEFLYYWNSATIMFEGDETYAPSTAAITR